MSRPLRARDAFLAVSLSLCFGTGVCFACRAPSSTTANGCDSRSFAFFERMAAISQKVPAEKVLPLCTQYLHPGL